MKPLFGGTINFYHLSQEVPMFRFYWRWKQYKGTFDCAIILFGHWFGVFLDHEIFYRDEV